MEWTHSFSFPPSFELIAGGRISQNIYHTKLRVASLPAQVALMYRRGFDEERGKGSVTKDSSRAVADSRTGWL